MIITIDTWVGVDERSEVGIGGGSGGRSGGGVGVRVCGGSRGESGGGGGGGGGGGEDEVWGSLCSAHPMLPCGRSDTHGHVAGCGA